MTEQEAIRVLSKPLSLNSLIYLQKDFSVKVGAQQFVLKKTDSGHVIQSKDDWDSHQDSGFRIYSESGRYLTDEKPETTTAIKECARAILFYQSVVSLFT